MKLIFKKSRDGDTPEDFHKYCDNKGKTLIFIETKEGRKFGGYTHCNWKDNHNTWLDNKNDFVFSLDLNKKYINVDKDGCSILPRFRSGPIFGYCTSNDKIDILFDETLNKGISNSSTCYETKGELNGGKKNFETKELEVYEVDII